MTNLNKENKILNEEKKDEDQIIKNDIELNEQIIILKIIFQKWKN